MCTGEGKVLLKNITCPHQGRSQGLELSIQRKFQRKKDDMEGNVYIPKTTLFMQIAKNCIILELKSNQLLSSPLNYHKD